MIRVGAGSEGEPELSGSGKQPGRGAYLCPDAGCLAAARKTGGLARALRRKVPERLLEDLEEEIERRRKV